MVSKKSQAKSNQGIRSVIDMDLTTLTTSCKALETLTQTIQSTLSSTSGIPAVLDDLKWDKFGKSIFNEWYLHDLLDLEMSPVDLGFDGFNNESLKRLTRILQLNCAVRNPQSAVAKMCSKTLNSIREKNEDLIHIDGDQLTHSGLFSLLSLVSRGSAEDPTAKIMTQIQSVLGARRRALEEDAQHSSSVGRLRDASPTSFSRHHGILASMSGDFDFSDFRSKAGTPMHFGPSSPMKSNAVSLHSQDDHFDQIVKLLDEKVAANERMMHSLEEGSSVHVTDDETLRVKLHHVSQACASYLDHQKREADRIAADVAKLDQYLRRQEESFGTGLKKFDEFKSNQEMLLSQNESEISATVSEIQAKQRKLKGLVDMRADAITELVQQHEATEQRRSMLQEAKVAISSYRDLYRKADSNESISTQYANIIQQCAQDCGQILGESTPETKVGAEDRMDCMKYIVRDQLDTITTLMYNIKLALDAIASEGNNTTSTGHDEEVGDCTAGRRVFSPMFFDRKLSPRETALDVLDVLGGNTSAEEGGRHSSTNSSSLPNTPGGRELESPSAGMIMNGPTMAKLSKLTTKYSTLLGQHDKLVSLCTEFSLTIPYTTDLEMGFRTLSLLTSDAFATPAEGSPNPPPQHTANTVRQPIVYFDAEMECPRLLLGSATAHSVSPSSPHKPKRLHLMSSFSEIKSPVLNPHPPPHNTKRE